MTRDDNRSRLLTIPDGWPARVVASILTNAADVTAEAIIGPAFDPDVPIGDGTYEIRIAQARATAVVETRSDGIAVYASNQVKERRP